MLGANEMARRMKVLSVGARVRIVQLLKDRALCVGALADRLGVSSAAVSQHLRILRDAGLVEAERRGNFMHYRLNEERLAEWRATAEELLAPGHEQKTCLEL
ncbi:MAG: ArsR family transcriptional regulator [Planctomycetes bacterium SM23_32]|nr:MAG: ArsR family transcriptional regulator [Planctomycetes bacterium SM23_32]